MLVLHPSSRCDVCLDAYNWETGPDEKTPHAIPCGHIFCQPCLTATRPSNCPMCRKPFAPERMKKLHVEEPTGSLIDHQEIDLLQRVALSWDSPEDHLVELTSEVEGWLERQHADGSKALRKAREALGKYQKLKTRKEQDRQKIKTLESIINRRERNAEMDRDTGKAVEESLLAQVEDLHTKVAQYESEVEQMRAHLAEYQYTRNPLPAPPEPVSLDHIPSFAEIYDPHRSTAQPGPSSSFMRKGTALVPEVDSPYIARNHYAESAETDSYGDTSSSRRDRKGKGKERERDKGKGKATYNIYRQAENGIFPGATPNQRVIPTREVLDPDINGQWTPAAGRSASPLPWGHEHFGGPEAYDTPAPRPSKAPGSPSRHVWGQELRDPVDPFAPVSAYVSAYVSGYGDGYQTATQPAPPSVPLSAMQSYVPSGVERTNGRSNNTSMWSELLNHPQQQPIVQPTQRNQQLAGLRDVLEQRPRLDNQGLGLGSASTMLGGSSDGSASSRPISIRRSTVQTDGHMSEGHESISPSRTRTSRRPSALRRSVGFAQESERATEQNHPVEAANVGSQASGIVANPRPTGTIRFTDRAERGMSYSSWGTVDAAPANSNARRTNSIAGSTISAMNLVTFDSPATFPANPSDSVSSFRPFPLQEEDNQEDIADRFRGGATPRSRNRQMSSPGPRPHDVPLLGVNPRPEHSRSQSYATHSEHENHLNAQTPRQNPATPLASLPVRQRLAPRRLPSTSSASSSVVHEHGRSHGSSFFDDDGYLTEPPASTAFGNALGLDLRQPEPPSITAPTPRQSSRSFLRSFSYDTTR